MGEWCIGVIGGSGLYELSELEDAQSLVVGTPWGVPSDDIRVGRIAGKRFAFLPRHGRAHQTAPGELNYRANVDALKRVGATDILAISAVGSLRDELAPGHFVAVDQFIDRTRGREDTFYDGPQTTHVSAADPYCADLRRTLLECARELEIPVADGGTVVVVQGPRFSTRAESRWFSAAGWDVVNMTQYPEAWLARELELCYANVSLVTDYDVGLEGMPDVPAVSAKTAYAVFDENLEKLRALLFAAVPRVGSQPADACAQALSSAIVH